MGTEALIELEAMQSLVTCMDGAAQDLRGIKTDLAGILGGVSLDTSPPQPLETAAAWVETQVPGLRRRLAMAQHIQASDPKFAHGAAIPVDESKISALSPSQAQQNGRDAAAALKASDGKPSDALMAEIRANQDDPYYASALAGQFSATELAALVSRLGQTYPGTHMPAAEETQEQKDWEKRYADQLATLGGVLGTATRTTSPDLRMPASWTQQWSEVITGDIKPTDDGGSTSGYSLALSLLVKNGTYGTDFLTKLTTDAYDYERSQGEDGDPVWGPKTTDNTVWDPDNPEGAPPNHDVMANLLAGLGRNPEAAQDFFYGDTGSADVHGTGKDDQHVPVNERLRYFVKDRLWDRGDVNSDDGDGFGDALRAATTYYRGTDADGQQSATIASQAMAMIAEHDGYGAHGFSLIHGSATSGWHMPSGLQSDVATILSSYTPDVFAAYADRNALGHQPPPWTQSDNPQVPGGPTGMSISRADLDTLMRSIGTNTDDFQRVSTSVLAFNQMQVQTVMEGMSPDAKATVLNGGEYTPLSNTMLVGPNVLSSLTTAAYSGDKDAEEIENINREAMNKFIDIAGNFPVTSLAKATPVAGWAVDSVIGLATDAAKQDPVDEADQQWSDEASSASDKLVDNYQNQLLRNGFYDPDVIARLQQLNPDNHVTGLPPGSGGQSPAVRYDDAGHPLGFGFGSDAYQAWANGTYTASTPTNGTMPGAGLNQRVQSAYVTAYGVHF